MKEEIRYIRRALLALLDPADSELRDRNLPVCFAALDYAAKLEATTGIYPTDLLGTLHGIVVGASRFYPGVFAEWPIAAPYTYWVPGPPGVTAREAYITLPRWEGVYGDNRRRCVRALLAYTDEL